jgi:hypothetical protein
MHRRSRSTAELAATMRLAENQALALLRGLERDGSPSMGRTADG